MKTYIITIAAILLVLAGSLASCEMKEEDPQEILFTEYSLSGTSCVWTNLAYDGKVIIINSNEELERYISYEKGGSYPEIDFSKQTLLLASGETTSGISKVTSNLLRQKGKIIMEVKVNLLVTGNIDHWTVSLLTSKISTKKIDLNLTIID